MTLWQSACPPRRMRELWCQQLQSLSELTRLRARLRASITGTETMVDPGREPLSVRLVLVADELTSNALRHGRGPVSTTLSRVDDLWMVTVSDASTEIPPQPAQGRDPALGGFGLYLIADLSEWHGWFLERGSKRVWAVLRGDPAPL